MQEAISDRPPEPVMTPAAAFARLNLVDGQVEQVPLDELTGRVSAVTCLLYPPGIPVVVPGERFDPQTRNLRLFENWEQRFRSFGNDVQGVVRRPLPGRQRRNAIHCHLRHRIMTVRTAAQALWLNPGLCKNLNGADSAAGPGRVRRLQRAGRHRPGRPRFPRRLLTR
jgi:hypothetical protein